MSCCRLTQFLDFEEQEIYYLAIRVSTVSGDDAVTCCATIKVINNATESFAAETLCPVVGQHPSGGLAFGPQEPRAEASIHPECNATLDPAAPTLAPTFDVPEINGAASYSGGQVPKFFLGEYPPAGAYFGFLARNTVRLPNFQTCIECVALSLLTHI